MKMKGLQSAVAIMSILIVLALGLLGYGIYKRFGNSGSNNNAVAIAEKQAELDVALAKARAIEENTPPTIALNNQEIVVAPGPQGLKNVTLPPRSSIRQMMPYKNGVALHVRTTKGEYIFYINAVTAKMEGALKINYASSAPPPRK